MRPRISLSVYEDVSVHGMDGPLVGNLFFILCAHHENYQFKFCIARLDCTLNVLDVLRVLENASLAC